MDSLMKVIIGGNGSLSEKGFQDITFNFQLKLPLSDSKKEVIDEEVDKVQSKAKEIMDGELNKVNLLRHGVARSFNSVDLAIMGDNEQQVDTRILYSVTYMISVPEGKGKIVNDAVEKIRRTFRKEDMLFKG